MELSDLLVSYNQVRVPERVELPVSLSDYSYDYPIISQTAKKEEEKKEDDLTSNYYISTIKAPGMTSVLRKWSSPYKDKNKWATELSNSYRKAGVTNENAIKMLVALDALESGWGRSAQGKFNFGNLTTGKDWKGSYVQGNDHDANGKAIKQKFRSYNSMDEYAKDKVQFLKRLYDFNENDNIATFASKLNGLNKGRRRYTAARNYATSLIGVFNSFKAGGVIRKYLNAGTIESDNTRVSKPIILLKIPMTYHLPSALFVQDNRSNYEKEQSLKQADAAYNLYIEDKKTEEGLNDLIGFLTFTDYATMGLGVGSLLTKGAKLIGKRITRNGILSNLNKIITRFNFSNKSIPQLLKITERVNNSFKDIRNFYLSDYLYSHLKKLGMSDLEIQDYINGLFNNLLEATNLTEFSGVKVYSPEKFNKLFPGSNGAYTIYEDKGIVTGSTVNLSDNSTSETALHEFFHAANKSGTSNVVGEKVNMNLNPIAEHNERIKASIMNAPLSIPNSPIKIEKEHSLYKLLLKGEELRARSFVTHVALNKYNTTFDDVQKVLALRNNKNEISSIGLTQLLYDNAMKFIVDNLDNYTTSDGVTPSNIWLMFNWFTPESANNFMKNVRNMGIPTSIYGLNNKLDE